MSKNTYIARRHPEAGIAIGPILFILAILAVIAVAMSSNVGQFGGASITDRIVADVSTQANLIRTKINECNIMYGTNGNYDGYPSSDAVNGTLVSAVGCMGDASGQQNLWSGARPAHLPPPTPGFGEWYYINTNSGGLGGSAAGGRCVWIVPTGSSPKNNAALVAGLTKAAAKFTNAISNDGTAEVNYDPASDSQKFIVWISVPASGSEDSKCKP